jgi:flagellar biosynthesis/type III secretory pathway protein FliH
LSFTATRLSLTFDGEPTPHKLVYRREEVQRLRDVDAIVDRARRVAFGLVQNARKAASTIEVRAATARRERERAAQIALIGQARALEEAYRLAQASFTAQLEATLDRVLAATLTHIGATLPAPQRLQIVCDQLAREVGTAPALQLHLSRVDETIYRAGGLRTPWAVKIDDTLAAGQCRLTSEQGQWELAFDTFMAALTAAAGAGADAEHVK